MKKHLLVAAAALLLWSCGPKQAVSASVAARNAEVIKESELREMLTYIASDEMQGRETGSEGQKAAGRYLINQYKKAGIGFPPEQSGYYQAVPAAYMNKKSREVLNDSENIWAFIKGDENPDEVVVLSAHYDHVGTENGTVYNGADDDGSGTVALVEIAKAIKKAQKNGLKLKRSLLILHVTGEEHGLHGSRYYSENPAFPLLNTVANVNIDMIGRRDADHKDNGNYVYVIGSDFLSTELDKICKSANEKSVNIFLDYKYNNKTDPNRFYYRSDHYNFAKNGIPSVFLFSGVHEDYHKPTDDVEKIEFDLLTKRAELAYNIVLELLTKEKRIVVDKPID